MQDPCLTLMPHPMPHSGGADAPPASSTSGMPPGMLSPQAVGQACHVYTPQTQVIEVCCAVGQLCVGVMGEKGQEIGVIYSHVFSTSPKPK